MSFLMGLNEGRGLRPGRAVLAIGGLGPGDDPVVKSSVIVLADTIFFEEFAREAEVDSAGGVEALEVFCG
jgi:hypothetical protein